MNQAKLTGSSSSLLILAAVVGMLLCLPAIGQTDSNAQPETSAEASPTPTPVATPIPLQDVAAEAGSTKEKLESIKKGVSESQFEAQIEMGLSELHGQVSAKKGETLKLLSGRPSLEALRIVELDWQALAKELPAWNKSLKAQITQIDLNLAEIARLKKVWASTLDAVEKPVPEGESPQGAVQTANETAVVKGIPPELLENIKSTIAAIENTEKNVDKRRADLLKLQTRVSKEEFDIKETLESISSLREKALANLFVRDSEPIWNAGTEQNSLGGVLAEAGDSYRDQILAIRSYASQKRFGFVLHGLVFVLFAVILFWARRRLREFVEKEPELKPAYSAFEFPIVVAIILSILLSSWFYPQAPRLLAAILGAAALLPGVLYLRRILDPPLFPILNALMIFYFVDLIRYVTSTLPFLSRVLFLVEMVAVIAFLVWFLLKKDGSEDGEHQKIYVVVKKAIPVLIVLFAIALVANIPGYVSLSFIIGNGVMGSAYVALILYAAIQIVKSIVIFGFRVRPFSGLGMVRSHRELIKEKIFQLLKWSAVLSWILLTLNIFSVRASIVGFLKDTLTTELVLGTISVSPADVLLFGFTIWLAFAVSRLVRFVLSEDVYPRINLAGGVSYAISTMLHYTLLVVGVLLAVAALGIDLTKFTILAGAFGVGLGFGMQAIVNNFVSGLILLFERPVKVDDFVQVGTHQGTLKRIGLRASVLRTLDGSEVILPNGQLISEEVTNWTFSDQERRLEIDVGVAYGSDPRVVMAILDKIGIEHDDILKSPEPRSIFMAFGESSLDFQLRAWTDNADQWVVVQSELTLAIHDALKEADIEIPFPQRDLHIKGVDETTVKALQEKAGKD